MIAMMLSLIFFLKLTHHLRRLYTFKNSRRWSDMIKNTRIRRTGALVMVVLGAILMFLAPEVWQGALLLALGVIIELVGITLEHNAD
jgi:Zn-dependent membrane protease YugP